MATTPPTPEPDNKPRKPATPAIEQEKSKTDLYLFLSASRPLYRANVLNTFFLPVGCTGKYRFKCSGSRVNVPSDLKKQLEGKRPSVMILFVDRETYTYHPIRMGICSAAFVDEDRLNILVDLGSFVHPASDITAGLKSALENPPERAPGPDDFDDGYYALLGPVTDRKSWKTGPEAWRPCVDAIAVTKAMIEPNDLVCFLRADVSGCVLKRRIGERKAYDLVRGQAAVVRLSCYIPRYEDVNGLMGFFSVGTTGPLKNLSKKSLPLTAPSTHWELHFISSVSSDEAIDRLEVSAQHATDGAGKPLPVILADEDLWFRIVFSKWRLLGLALFGALYVFGQFLQAAGGFYWNVFGLGVAIKPEKLDAAGKGIGFALSAIALFAFYLMLRRKPGL